LDRHDKRAGEDEAEKQSQQNAAGGHADDQVLRVEVGGLVFGNQTGSIRLGDPDQLLRVAFEVSHYILSW
jgi:hypothetical protein